MDHTSYRVKKHGSLRRTVNMDHNTIHTYIFIHMDIYIYIHVYTYTSIYMYAYMYAHIYIIYNYNYIYIYVWPSLVWPGYAQILQTAHMRNSQNSLFKAESPPSSERPS